MTTVADGRVRRATNLAWWSGFLSGLFWPLAIASTILTLSGSPHHYGPLQIVGAALLIPMVAAHCVNRCTRRRFVKAFGKDIL